tara:strand:+ start:76 stop:813 length:738 start_codon:yes stop_codon:yes gene_type:complete
VNKEQVVLGSCLSSLCHSYKQNIPIILTNFSGPTDDEIFETPCVIDDLGFNKKNEAWTYLKFVLALRGLVINYKEPSSVRLSSDQVKIINANEVVTVGFNKCFLYQDRHIKSDLTIKDTLNIGLHKVLDYMKIRVGTHLGLDKVSCTGSFLDSVVLEGSSVIGVSYLSGPQLLDFNYSDTITRFTTQKLLQGSGLIALPYVDRDKKFKRKLSLEVLKRDVIPMQLTTYIDTDKVKNFGNQERPGK